jgi:hypothetical protein
MQTIEEQVAVKAGATTYRTPSTQPQKSQTNKLNNHRPGRQAVQPQGRQTNWPTTGQPD